MLAGGCDILCHIIHSLPVTAGLTVAKSRLGSKPQFWEDEHKRPGFVSYCLQCWLRKRYVVIRESAARVREAVPVARGSSIWRINLGRLPAPPRVFPEPQLRTTRCDEMPSKSFGRRPVDERKGPAWHNVRADGERSRQNGKNG